MVMKNSSALGPEWVSYLNLCTRLCVVTTCLSQNKQTNKQITKLVFLFFPSSDCFTERYIKYHTLEMTYWKNAHPVINLKGCVTDNVGSLSHSHYSIWVDPFFLHLPREQRNQNSSCSKSKPNSKGQSHHSPKNIPVSDVN